MIFFKKRRLYLKEFIRNRNVKFVLIGFSVVLAVFTMFVNTFEEIEAPDAFRLEQRYEKWGDFLEAYENMQEPSFQYTMAYNVYEEWHQYDEERYLSWQAGDYAGYAEGTEKWYEYGLLHTEEPFEFYSSKYYIKDRYYASFDGAYNYGKTAKLMELLTQKNRTIDKKMVELESSLTLLPKLFTNHLSYILLLAVAMLSFLLVTQMRGKFLIKHSPSSKYFNSWISTSLIFTVCLLFFGVLLTSVYLTSGDLHLFYDIPMLDLSQFDAEREILTKAVFSEIAVWQYLGILLGVYLLLSVLITRIYVLGANLLPKKEILLLLPAAALAVSAFLTAQRWWGTFREVQYNPLMYLDFGKILSGETAFYLGNNQLSLMNGLLIFLGMLIIVELLNVFVIFVKERRRTLDSTR
ncbi:hypothetical protein [Enterococcus olivae]